MSLKILYGIQNFTEDVAKLASAVASSSTGKRDLSGSIWEQWDQLGSPGAAQMLLWVEDNVPLLLLLPFACIGINTFLIMMPGEASITSELFAASEILLCNTCFSLNPGTVWSDQSLEGTTYCHANFMCCQTSYSEVPLKHDCQYGWLNDRRDTLTTC